LLTEVYSDDEGQNRFFGSSKDHNIAVAHTGSTSRRSASPGAWTRSVSIARSSPRASPQASAQLDDQLAGLAWLRTASFVARGRIAVAGHSFGGIQTVLGVERADYCAGIDRAGGAQSWKLKPQFQAVMTRAVRNARAAQGGVPGGLVVDVTPLSRPAT
jgi:dienelactone hydrolase